MKYLLDTNICIYIIKQKPSQVFNKFKMLPLGDIGISSISLAELRYGIQKSTKPKTNTEALNQFLLPLDILDFDADAAAEYGMLRAELERKGTPIGALDVFIAAHAKAKDLTLVTNNEKEFKRIEGLYVENWVD